MPSTCIFFMEVALLCIGRKRGKHQLFRGSIDLIAVLTAALINSTTVLISIQKIAESARKYIQVSFYQHGGRVLSYKLNLLRLR